MLEDDTTVGRLDVELIPTAGFVGRLDVVLLVVLVAAVGKAEVMLRDVVQTPDPVPAVVGWVQVTLPVEEARPLLGVG